MLKSHIMYLLDNDRPVHPPVGGYLFLATLVGVAVLSIEVAMTAAADDDFLRASVWLVLGVGMFTRLSWEIFKLIDRVWERRSLPANLNSRFHKLRKLYIALAPVVGLVDVLVLHQPLLLELKLMAVYLALGAMLSFIISIYAMSAKDTVARLKETLENLRSRIP